MNKQYQISKDIKDKLVEHFLAIENMANELTTGNVFHKKAAIKGFVSRAKEFFNIYT